MKQFELSQLFNALKSQLFACELLSDMSCSKQTKNKTPIISEKSFL